VERQIIATKDGSHTILLPGTGISYHSRHGAIAESVHIFIRTGLLYFIQQHPGLSNLNILEIGFGTGLNAFLTTLEAEKLDLNIYYTALETTPLNTDEVKKLNYPDLLGSPTVFLELHSRWNAIIQPVKKLKLLKIQVTLQEFFTENRFHLIYFDAFGPGDQPELWTEEIFTKLHGMMEPGGILVTYCSRGSVRRAMKAAGFEVKKLPGPWGKREIVRGGRLID
jgi:tRNA U34 5-methylaminomethyl-2-thiouridine-forming methyltransferase MnmC